MHRKAFKLSPDLNAVQHIFPLNLMQKIYDMKTLYKMGKGNVNTGILKFSSSSNFQIEEFQYI